MNRIKWGKKIKGMIWCVLFSEFLQGVSKDGSNLNSYCFEIWFIFLKHTVHCIWILLKTTAFSEHLSLWKSILDVFLWDFFVWIYIIWGGMQNIWSFCLASFLVTLFFFPWHYFFRIHWQLIWISYLITEHYLTTCKPFFCEQETAFSLPLLKRQPWKQRMTYLGSE